MKYTRTALGLLNAQYRSVLKKCFMINMGLFALGASIWINPAVAIDVDYGKDMLPTMAGAWDIYWKETDKSDNSSVSIRWDRKDKLRYYSWSTAPLGPDTPYFWTNNQANTKDGGVIYNDEQRDSTIISYRGIDYDDGLYIGNHSGGSGGVLYNSTTGSYKLFAGNFVGNYAASSGGVILNNGTIDTVSGDFIGNYAANNGGIIANCGTISSVRGYSRYVAGNHTSGEGGAIGNMGTIGSISTNFYDNYVDTINNYDGNGGAISNWDTIGSISGNFIENYVHASGDGYGGAIYNDYEIGSISGSFVGNYALGNYYAQGGAIWNYGTIEEIKSDFTNNYVNADISEGGAIYNEGQIKSLSGNFTGNSAYNGAAIYNGSDGSITIDGASEFKDNGEYYYRALRAIYNDGTIDFKSGKIVLNDGIGGDGGTLNLAGQTTATANNDVISINNTIAGNTVNLTQGTLKLGHYDSTLFNTKFVGTFADDVEFNVSGGKLTTQDDEIHEHNLGKLDLQKDLNTAIDVDLNTKTGDVLTGSTTATSANDSKILIDNIKILNDGDNNIVNVLVADNNIKDLVGLANDISIEMPTGSLDSYLVVYEKNTTSGNLKFGKNGTLETAVQFGEGEKVYTSNVEIFTKDDLGVLRGNSLSINGNGHTIDGKNNGGMSIENGQTLNINDVSIKNFAGAFAENNGTMNINASEGNEVNLNSGISGNGTINARGSGDLNVNSQIENKLTLANGTLKLGDNGSISELIAAGGAFSAQDNAIKGHNLGKLDLQKDLNTAIDVDLNAKTGDVLTGSKTATSANDSKILIDNIKILNDGTNHIIKVKVADENIKDSMELSNNVIVDRASNDTNNYLIVYEKDATSGNLKFGQVDALETAVQFANADSTFTTASDYTVDTDLGTLTKSELSINGNGHTVDGSGFGGMNIAQNQTVSLNDVTITGFAGAFAENNGTMNINASEGNEVNLNSGISGNGTINARGSGDLNVNSQIENKLTLANGTLKLGDNGSISELIAAGGAFSAQDNAIKGYNLGKLDLQKDLNTSIDVDLNAKTGDVLTGSTIATSANDSKILIDNIKILNDGTNHIIKVKVADENIKDSMELANNVTVDRASNDTNNYLIVYEKDATSGNLKFGQVDALETAVQFKNANKAFSMGSDITTDTDLGALTGDSLSISGNGHTIDGSDFGGMNIAQNQTVSLNDVTIKGFTGSFAENNGTMNIKAGEGNEVNLNSGINGNGTINANSAGTLNINSAVNANTLNTKGNGLFNFNDTVAADTMNVAGGELNLKNGTELANVENFVANGGVLNVGDQTINLKNATFNDGSTVAINVKSDGNGLLKADSLTVNGGNLKATLGQGLVENGSKTVTLLESGTAFTNNFTDVLDNNMYRFEKAEKAGDYIISLAKTAEEVSKENGGSQNNAGEAKAWVDGSKFEQGSVSADVANKLADLAQNDAKGFNEALSALAPSDTPEVRTNSVNHNTEMFRAVVTHLDDVSKKKQYGLSSGDAVDGVSVWAKAFGNHAKVDDTSKAYGFKSDGYGATLGIEKQLNDAFKVGLGYSYFYNDVDGFMRDSEVNTHTGFVYGEYRPNAWYVNAIASYGYSDYDETKHVAGSKYKAKYDVDNIGAQVMTGYNANVAKIDITPEAGLRYNNIHRDNYVDGAGQAVKAETMDVLTAVAGVKVGKDLVSCFGAKEFYWRPEARLAATYDLISDKENAVVSLSNGSGYVVNGQRLNRFGIEAGAGVTFFLTPDVESSVGYEGKFRKDYQDHTGYISAKYKF